MYSNHSVQIKYRRKIYENVASLAYRNAGDEQFKWLPETIVSLMGEQNVEGELSSDLDYAAEACYAALNLTPKSYKDVMRENTAESLKAMENEEQSAHSNLCVLGSVCRKCAQTMGSVRHCAVVCPTGAISVDSKGSTVIDQGKCVSCGKCMLACPYGAIIDKSYIFQLIHSIKQGSEVYALLSPGLHEQFKEIFDEESLTGAFRLLGFADTYELKEVGHGPLEDCSCDMWRSAQHKAHSICEVSNLAAINLEIRSAVAELRASSPDCKVVLISACTRSKLIFEREKGLHVDFVLDYEELMGMMDARGVSNEAIVLKVGDKDIEELKTIY